MADRIVVMRDGRVAQAGAPLDLYDRPENTFVAGFIGSPSMNLLDGVFEAGAVAAAGVRLDVPGLMHGQRVTIGVRPEHLAVGGPGEGAIEAVVKVVEPTGSETHLVAEAGGRELTAVSRERLALQPGERVGLRPDPARLHVFDAATGERI